MSQYISSTSDGIRQQLVFYQSGVDSEANLAGVPNFEGSALSETSIGYVIHDRSDISFSEALGITAGELTSTLILCSVVLTRDQASKIHDAYAFLAQNFHFGDEIFLFGHVSLHY